MNTVCKIQLCESDDSTDYEATVEAKLLLFRAKRKSSLLVYTVSIDGGGRFRGWSIA